MNPPGIGIVGSDDRMSRRTPRTYTEDPVGPLELLSMVIGRELFERERPDEDWFGLVGSSVSGFCRRACEERGIDWNWMRLHIVCERTRDQLDPR